MNEEHLKIWDAVKQPPPSALRQIQAGRLRGKTDINPQWRYQAMTEQFGPCGIGWKYEITRVWNEPASDNQIFCFAEVNLYIYDNRWSEPIPGIGGSMLVTKEQSGLHSSDEGYKMAITDALSVCMKMLGFASDVYAGLWDGSKYKTQQPAPQQKQAPPKQSSSTTPQQSTEAPTTTTEEVTDSLIDLSWLQEQLKILQSKGLKAWSNAMVVKSLNVMTGKDAKSVSEAVKYLDKDQASAFVNKVMDTVSMA